MVKMIVEVEIEDIPTNFPSCNFLFLSFFGLCSSFFSSSFVFFFEAFQKTRMMIWRSFRISKESV